MAATVNMLSTGYYGPPGEIDLSAYQGVTRIEIVNVTDPAGLLYDDFTYDLPPALDLTATDHGDATNHATAIQQTSGSGSGGPGTEDLYIPADSSGIGYIDLSADLRPGEYQQRKRQWQRQRQRHPDGRVRPPLDFTVDSPTIDDTYSSLVSEGELSNVALETAPAVPRLRHPGLV